MPPRKKRAVEARAARTPPCCSAAAFAPGHARISTNHPLADFPHTRTAKLSKFVIETLINYKNAL